MVQFSRLIREKCKPWEGYSIAFTHDKTFFIHKHEQTLTPISPQNVTWNQNVPCMEALKKPREKDKFKERANNQADT